MKHVSWIFVGLITLFSALGTFPSAVGAILFLLTVVCAVALRFVAAWENKHG